MRPLVYTTLSLVLVLAAAPDAVRADDDAESKKARDARIKEVFDFCDRDADGTISLEEQNTKTGEFYAEYRKVHKAAKADRQAVKDRFKGLLKLRTYLAADLNDDNLLSPSELRNQLRHKNDSTLSEDDIDRVMRDYRKRMLKGVRLFPEDALRDLPGKGRTKKAKLEWISKPYRRKLVGEVYFTRRIMAEHREIQNWNKKRTALWGKLGRKVRIDYLRNGRVSTFEAEVTRVTGTRAFLKHPKGSGQGNVPQIFGRSDDSVIKFRSGREPYWLLLTYAKKYNFDYDAEEVTIEVEAGKFRCKRITVQLLGHFSKAWYLVDYPEIKAKTATREGEVATELVLFK